MSINQERLTAFNKLLKTEIVGNPARITAGSSSSDKNSSDGVSSNTGTSSSNSETSPPNTNEYWDSIDSTNNRLAQLAREGAPEGTTVISRQQTAGRGRLGREWVSEFDSGLYLSTLLRPERSIAELPVITLCLGVAAKRAILALSGIEPGLKWVNDLIYDTKKLAGILVEIPIGATKSSQSNALVIGIGINLKTPSSPLPQEIADKAIYLDQICDTNVEAADLAAELCFQIEEVYKKMQNYELNLLLDEWRASSVTLGQTIQTANGDIEGLAEDIDQNGALLVKTKDGTRLLHAGEITIRGKDGSYSY